jgi:hypothetical protein
VAGEVLGQGQNILSPFSQGRDVHRNHLKAEEEILPEESFSDQGVEILVGGRHDADVHDDSPGFSQREDLAVFQEAQQLGLKCQRKVPDFIQEEGPLVGSSKDSKMVSGGTGEGSLAIAKELPLEEFLRYRRAVEGDVGSMSASGEFMNLASQDLLSGTAFSGDDHRGARAGEAGQLPEQLSHGLGGGHDTREGGDLGMAGGLGAAGTPLATQGYEFQGLAEDPTEDAKTRLLSGSEATLDAQAEAATASISEFQNLFGGGIGQSSRIQREGFPPGVDLFEVDGSGGVTEQSAGDREDLLHQAFFSYASNGQALDGDYQSAQGQVYRGGLTDLSLDSLDGTLDPFGLQKWRDTDSESLQFPSRGLELGLGI